MRCSQYISGLSGFGLLPMYVYDEYDHQMVQERVDQYRDQTERFLAGELPEDEFQQLRLRNGLYIQRLAPMLRIAIPYGMLSSQQLRKLAHITRTYDRGYAHFTTRQNLQLNWPKLEEVPDILQELAEVEMHAIQTSGSCIRNVTSDQFAGVTPDEVEDSRPWAEIIRQWSTFHPEFNWLPRKFKIAVTAAQTDRAAVQVHDIGIRILKNSEGLTRFEVLAGGGLGRTPVIAPVIKSDLEPEHLLTYLEAILRVYNRFGRRDNKYKARIKILVRAMTAEVFAEKVEEEWLQLKDGASTLTTAEIERIQKHFTTPDYETFAEDNSTDNLVADSSGFCNWYKQNVKAHKRTGYSIVNLALKQTAVAPGDVTDRQLEIMADLADEFSFGEIRVTHEQNVTLADVPTHRLRELWEALTKAELATPNLGLLTDIICCPGGDYCSLANAKSIPVAEAIQRQFDDTDELQNIGDLDINISGCMNACGHHHVGNIGILGVDKKGAEFYQVSIGGSGYEDASLAKILGPSFAQAEIPEVIQQLVDVYKDNREDKERFIDTYRRIGIEPYKAAVYPA